MKRRDFSLGLATTALAAAVAPSARAQGEPAEGSEYTRLRTPVPGATPGKVEVIEFFGYWCPHCAAFEPTLDAWARKLPAEVVLKRVPVAFQAWHEPYQKLFYALEVMGLLDATHAKVFTAVHSQRLRLERDADLQQFAGANGIDFAKLGQTMKSFSVSAKCTQARQLAGAWAIDGVPTLGVGGRFVTSVSRAGGPERTIAVIDALIRKSRA